jgi:MinD superfamily P-loop ATPase
MAWLTGYPREKIAWFPTIDPEKCVECGMCMNCGKHVFDWTEHGAIVARPLDCVPTCSVCANLCLGNAITFPENGISAIRELYTKEGIWAKIKRQLKAEGKLVVKSEQAAN